MILRAALQQARHQPVTPAQAAALDELRARVAAAATAKAVH